MLKYNHINIAFHVLHENNKKKRLIFFSKRNAILYDSLSIKRAFIVCSEDFFFKPEHKNVYLTTITVFWLRA